MAADPLHYAWLSIGRDLSAAIALAMVNKPVTATRVLNYNLGLIELEAQLIWHLPEARYYLAGSNAHGDLEWLREEMPRLASKFHHRVLDVSAVKLFCESLGMPALPSELPPLAEGEERRASDYVRESMDHLRQCRDWLAVHGMEEFAW